MTPSPSHYTDTKHDTPSRYSIQTQDMTPHPVTVYRHSADRSLGPFRHSVHTPCRIVGFSTYTIIRADSVTVYMVPGRPVTGPSRHSIHDMAVGTGGGGRGAIAPPPIFCQPKKFKIIKTTTYRSVYRNMAKIW